MSHAPIVHLFLQKNLLPEMLTYSWILRADRLGMIDDRKPKDVFQIANRKTQNANKPI